MIPKYQMELHIVVTADDRLALEYIQEKIAEDAMVVAAGYQVDIVGQPIQEVEAEDVQKES